MILGGEYMKRIWKDIGIAFTMGMVVPAVLLVTIVSLSGKRQKIPELTEPILETDEIDENLQNPTQVHITVLAKDGMVMRLPLNEYLTGVVLAEMPVSFETEALKAQSVVARTYTIRASQKISKHTEADVCVQSECCQAYISPESFLDKGGKKEDINRIYQIVQSTDAEVLTYEGDLIEATYFSCSGGYTEDAVAVWGTDVPYLQSVISPGEENAAHYTDSVEFTCGEFASLLGIELTGTPDSWFSDITYTDGGGVDTMTIGGNSFSGTELRKRLGLRSTAFTVIPQGDTIVINTRGFGHRVGMSQYGADAMAREGSTYQQILNYYYQGTQLVRYFD